MEVVGTEEHVGLNQAFWTHARAHVHKCSHKHTLFCFAFSFFPAGRQFDLVLFLVCFCGFVLANREM